MSGHYTKIACDRCGDMYEILTASLLETQFICSRCLRALLQERLNEPETDAPATPEEPEWPTAGCESDPVEVELDNDLIADLKQQLDTALADLENEQSLRRVLLRTTRFWQRQAVDDAVRIAKLIAAPWYVRLRRWARRQWEHDIYA
jgi:hypothetical protein